MLGEDFIVPLVVRWSESLPTWMCLSRRRPVWHMATWWNDTFFFEKPRGRLDDWVTMIYPPNKTYLPRKQSKIAANNRHQERRLVVFQKALREDIGTHKLDLYQAIQFMTLEWPGRRSGPTFYHSKKVTNKLPGTWCTMVVWWNLLGVIYSSS